MSAIIAPEINEQFLANWENAGINLELRVLERLKMKLMSKFEQEHYTNRDTRVWKAIQRVNYHIFQKKPKTDVNQLANDVFKHMRANIK
jgi:hypothetical protein